MGAQLYQLNLDSDSFIILEQKDPQNPKEYWFIQSAIALQGPDQGKYIVEVGFSGPQLWGQLVATRQEAARYFFDAYHHKPVDFSNFQKSDIV